MMVAFLCDYSQFLPESKWIIQQISERPVGAYVEAPDERLRQLASRDAGLMTPTHNSYTPFLQKRAEVEIMQLH